MKWNRTKKLGLLISGMLISVVMAVGNVNGVFARTADEAYTSILKKATYQLVYKCYNGDSVKSSIDKLSSYKDVSSLYSGTDHRIALVTGEKIGGFDHKIQCKKFLNKSNFKKITGFDAPGTSRSSNKVEKFMEAMGYELTGTGGGECYAMQYKKSNGKLSLSNKVCAVGSKLRAEAENGADLVFYIKTSKAGTKTVTKVCLRAKRDGGWSEQGCSQFKDSDKFDGTWLKTMAKGACGGPTCKATHKVQGETVVDASYTLVKDMQMDSLGEVGAKFIEGGKKKAAFKAIQSISGNDKITGLKQIGLDDIEVRVLYQRYLTNFYKLSPDCSGNADLTLYKEIWWYEDGKVKQCGVSTQNAANKEKKVNGVDGSNNILKFESLSLDGLIAAINKLPRSYDEEIEGSISDATRTDGGSSTDDAVCYENSGKLGWIICPIIKGASEAGTYLWDRVQEMLNVPAQEVFAGDSGVRTAWGAIRDIANVIFVVLFLMVIFSQLTGVGIDNYGIKKILPKLIVAAILINLSYVICELAVDISNILGNGLESLLSSQAAEINYGSKEIKPESQLASGLVLTALAGGGAALYVLMNPLGIIALGIAVLGVVIAIVIAVIFLYLILVIRQAGVVLLVVLAPAAVVCYMLPNTEKWYKRWFELFKALLLVYPICGAMVGGGQLAGAILASIDEPAMKVAAMIVTVAPFFLIPTLLRSSLSLMGNIGARLQNVAGRARRGAAGATGGAIRSSEGAKNHAKLIGEEKSARWAQRTVNRLGGRTGLSGRNQHRLLDAQKALNARMLGNAEAEVGAYALDSNTALSRATSARETQEFKAYQDQFAGFSRDQLVQQANSADTWLHQAGGQQRMSALIGAMESRGMENQVYGMLQKNNVGNMSSVMQTLASSDNKVLKAYGKRGNGVSYNDFMQGTARNADGTLNTEASMKAYVDGKGADFLNNLDDKALSQINAYSNNNNQIMSNDLIAEGQARLSDQNAVNQLDQMMDKRPVAGISGEQLAKFNTSTVNKLTNRAMNSRNQADLQALLQASDAIAADPRLASSLSAANKAAINNVRTAAGSAPIP